MRSVFYTDFANPTREGYTWNADMGRALDEFARGKVVFYFGYAFDLPQILAQAPQMNLEVIPIPQLDNTAPVNVANYWVESVTKKSAHKNEAWDFIRFITSPEGVGAYTQATRQPTPAAWANRDAARGSIACPICRDSPASTKLVSRKRY